VVLLLLIRVHLVRRVLRQMVELLGVVVHGSPSLLKVHELLTLLSHHACGDIVGAEGVAELSPRHMVIRGESGGVVGPPRASITPQLLCGKEGLLHLGAAQEPELGLHDPKPVVGLKRLSCLDDRCRWSELELEHSLPHCHHGWSWPRAAAAIQSARRGTQESRRSLELDLAVEADSRSLGSSRLHFSRYECSPFCHPNRSPLA
jgi:hypothetical protein